VKKQITTINERVRAFLGITRDEYALCSYIQFRSADPRGRKDGWCDDKKEDLAQFVGITRPGLYKMIDRLSYENLLEVDAISGYIRTTAKWVDADGECKQSLQSGVNKVYKECKQSLQSSVNKVTRIYKVEEDIKKEKSEENAPDFSVELQPLEDERKNTPHIAPPPPKKESAPTVDDLEAPILEWAHSEQGKPNIYKWYSDAGRTCTRNDVESLITTFCATYSTIGDAGKRMQFMADPLGYFKLRFKVFLKDQPRFERPQAQRHEIGQSSTSSTLPKNIPVFR
jgi:hypothetical protein